MFWVELYLILQMSLWFVTHLGLDFSAGERNALVVLLGLGAKSFLLFIFCMDKTPPQRFLEIIV